MNQATKTKKIFDGRYEILSIVGRGSRSVVYHARHVSNPQAEVALKVLTEKKGRSPSGEQLRKEALALVSSRHKYVVRLDDFHSVGTLCYLAMEFAPESDLRRYLGSHNNNLPINQIERFLLQASEALTFIHRVGIVHRDIKPDNILVMNDKEIRIADFGVAVLPGELAALDELRNGVGTLNYMAPEVLEGTACDERSDIFSLGVTFYELVSGVSPFENVTLAQLVEARRAGNYPPLSMLAPQAPAYLCNLIEKAMSYDPEDRFQSARELSQALLSGRSGEKIGGTNFDEKEPQPAARQPTKNAAKNDRPRMRRRDENVGQDAESSPKSAEHNKPSSIPPISEPPAPKGASSLERAATFNSAAANSAASKQPETVFEPISQADSDKPIVKDNKPQPTDTSITPDQQTSPSKAQPVAPEGAFIPVDETVVVAPPKSVEEARQLAAKITAQTAAKQQPAESRERKPTASLETRETKSIKERIEAAKSMDKRPNKSMLGTQEISESTDLAPTNRLRPFLLVFLLAVFSVFVIFGAGNFVSKFLSSRGGKESKRTASQLLLPSAKAQDFIFPEVPTGTYVGSLVGLREGKSVPMLLVSFAEQDRLIITVGLPGWTPVTLSPRKLLAGQETPSRDLPLQVASNGIILSLRGIHESGIITGFFTDVLSGAQGEWTLEPQSIEH